MDFKKAEAITIGYYTDDDGKQAIDLLSTEGSVDIQQTNQLSYDEKYKRIETWQRWGGLARDVQYSDTEAEPEHTPSIALTVSVGDVTVKYGDSALASNYLRVTAASGDNDLTDVTATIKEAISYTLEANEAEVNFSDLQAGDTVKVVLSLPEEFSVEGYEITLQDKELTVQKADLTCTLKADLSITEGETMPDEAVIIAGFKNNDTASDLTGTLAFDYFEENKTTPTTLDAMTAPDIYWVVPKGYSSINYNITYVGNFIEVTDVTE